jgi:hypothetical protein
MIARKIIYKGHFNDKVLAEIYDISRKIEITGEVKMINPHEIHLHLEGDPSMIKLLQHQVERKVKTAISDKVIEPLAYQHYLGLTLLM